MASLLLPNDSFTVIETDEELEEGELISGDPASDEKLKRLSDGIFFSFDPQNEGCNKSQAYKRCFL